MAADGDVLTVMVPVVELLHPDPVVTVYVTGYVPGPAIEGKNCPLDVTYALPPHVPPGIDAVSNCDPLLLQNGPLDVILTAAPVPTDICIVDEETQPFELVTVYVTGLKPILANDGVKIPEGLTYAPPLKAPPLVTVCN
jgi:hypothetical protein